MAFVVSDVKNTEVRFHTESANAEKVDVEDVSTCRTSENGRDDNAHGSPSREARR